MANLNAYGQSKISTSISVSMNCTKAKLSNHHQGWEEELKGREIFFSQDEIPGAEFSLF